MIIENNFSEKYFIFSVKGKSMEPTLKENDRLLVKNANDYRAGDILVFLYDEDIIVHRLIRKTSSGFVCKGDNSFRIENIKNNDIIGKVLLVNFNQLPKINRTFLKHSFLVGKKFIENNYCKKTTKNTECYKKYYNLYLLK